MKIDISLTDFIEYVNKSGTPKLTFIKRIKNRPVYHPNTDYWKKLRDQIEDVHQNNKDKSELDVILNEISDAGKERNYQELIAAYKSFLGKKEVKWFVPPYKIWINNDLHVRLNPELGLFIDGDKFAIKLYFKSERLTKSRIDLILTLLEKEFKSCGEDYRVALLDIRAKKLHSKNGFDPDSLMPLLIGEAIAFESIWKNI